MQNLKIVDLPFGKKTRWFVSFVDFSTGHLYCQLAEASIFVKYERLYQDIQAWSEAGKLKEGLLNPYIGEFCLTEFPQKQSWYRSQITEVDKSTKQAEVFFIDHGNSEVVSFSSIQKLPTAFTELPPQAYECILANVEPVRKNDKWSDAAIKLIEELVSGQELVGVPIRLQRNLLVLKLFVDKDSTVTVAEQLISAGFGQRKVGSSSCSGSIAPTKSISSVDSNSSRRSSVTSVESSLKVYQEIFRPHSTSADKYIDVFIVFSEGLDKFFCQPVSEKEKLNKLQGELQNFYTKNKPTLGKLSKNIPCCALFEDGLWYRGIIKKVTDSTSSIFFVDFGNIDEVLNNDIRALDAQFFAFPTMALECKLGGIIPLNNSKFSTEANQSFENLTMNNDSIVAFILSVIDNKHEVILYDKDDNSINQRLINDGYVAQKVIEPEITQSSILAHRSITSNSEKIKNPILVKYVAPSIYTAQEEKVFISYSFNPHHFYVNFVSTSNGLQELMSQLSTFYKTESPVSSRVEFKVGHPCVAKYSEDDEYYRAEILEMNNNKVKIQFVDYGNTDDTTLGELKALCKEFIKLPKQGIACKLNGIEPITGNMFSADACQKFEEIVMEKELLMTIYDIQNGYCVVGLLDEAHGSHSSLNVTNTLISSGLVKSGKDYSKKDDFGVKVSTEESYRECKIDVECYIDVAPVHIENPSQFCCHVVQNAVEFKKLTELLNDFYATAPVDNNIKWKKLMPCVALFDVDQCWYRAIITSVTNDALDVTFIDFGNSATVSKSDIRPIMSYFIELPAQVFVCTLADVEAKNKSWTPEAIESFQNMALDKHLAAFIKEKHDNNVYSILLYDTKTSEKNISQLLIEQNFANSVTNQNAKGCSRYTVPGTKEKVFITSFVNLSEFFLQILCISPELDSMMDELHAYYSQLNDGDMQVISPIIGQYCSSLFTEDDYWYRAYIKEVDGRSVTVEYIDYGNAEHLSSHRVKVLSPEFERLPRFALPCRIKNHESLVGFTSGESMLLDQEFTAEFITKDPPYTVELYTSDGNALSKTIAESLHNKHAVVKRKIAEPTPKANEVKAAGTRSQVELFNEKAKIGSKHSMYFLEAASPDEFYCQPVASESDLETLMESISVYVTDGKKQRFQGRVGDYALALYKEDSAWYRVKVLEIVKSTYKVLYCDYGNKDIVSRDEIYALPPELALLEQQAVLCSLNGLQSTLNEWTNGAIEMFNTICGEKMFDAQIVSKKDDKLEVVLTDPTTNENVGDRLISAGFAVRTGSTPPLLKPQEQSSPQQLSYKDPEVLSKEIAYCTQVCSSTLLKIQLQKYEEQLNQLMEKLSSEFSSCSNLTSGEVGSPCLAVFTDDEQWYRAEITSLEGEHAIVTFVDYGNTQRCEISKLKTPKIEMMELPRTCIDCKLHDVYSEDLNNKKSDEYLKTSILDQKVSLEVIPNTKPHEAYVYLEGQKDHVNDTLYTMFEIIIKLQYSAAEISEKEIAYCTQVFSSTLLKIQLQKYEENLNQLMEKLSSESSSCPNLTSAEVGSPCLAVFTDDEQWYRAEITSLEGKHAIVTFVDYGNTQKCEVSKLKTPKSEMMELPRTCIDCKLFDVNPTDIDIVKAEEYLDNLVMDQKVTLDVQIQPDNEKCLEAYVFIDGQSGHINDKLYSLFAIDVGEIDRTDSQASYSLAYTEPNVSEKEMAYCTQICSSILLKIQLQKYEENLNQLMEKLSSESSSCPNLTSAEVGSPCLAVFTDDEQWYRAEITSLEGQHAIVTFVDYGNTQKCEVSKLKTPKSEMMELPRTCIDCKLYDVHQHDLDNRKCEEYMKDSLSDHVMTVEVIEKEPLSAYVYVDSNLDHVNDLLYSHFALESEEQKSGEQPSNESPVPLNAPNDVYHEESPAIVDFDIAPAKIIKEVNYSAVCYLVESATNLKCQLCDYKEKINNVMKHIDKNIANFPHLSNPEVNKCCIAKYSADEGWYRARIVEVKNDLVKVHFVDFGNTDDVSVADIRRLTPECSNIPQTCISVDLYNVYTEDLNESATKEWLKEKFLKHVLRLEVMEVEGDRVSAYIYDEGRDEHINDQIYELFSLGEESDPSTAVSATTNLDIPKPEIEKGSSLLGLCLVVVSANEMKCQLRQFSEELDEVMLDIAKKASNLPQEKQIEVGKPCIAKSTDGNWYRVRIIQNSPHVKVDFLDFGNVEIVNDVDLKVLPDEFKVLPQTCLAVHLNDVHLSDIDVNKTMLWLSENFLNQTVRLEIVDASLCLNVKAYVFQEVYPEWKDTHINDHIYSLFTNDEDDIKGNTSEDDSGISEGGIYCIERASIESNTNRYVTCTHIESAVLLKCQLNEYSEELEKIASEFEQYATSMEMPDKFTVGGFCLARFSEDQLWYRAQILKEIGNTVSVEYIDYGNTDTIPKTETRELCHKFTGIPRCNIDVQLHDVHMIDIDPKRTMEWLEETCLGCSMKAEIKTYTNQVADAIVFLDSNNETSVNDQIYENFTSEFDDSSLLEKTTEFVEVEHTQTSIVMDETITDVSSAVGESTGISGISSLSSTIEGKNENKYFPPPEILKQEKILCTYIESASKLSFQLLKYESVLNNITEILITPSMAFLQDVKEGMHVIARSEEDNNWYRASVMKTLKESAHVLYVDFGNTEIIPLSNLRAVDDDRFLQPVTCVNCRLFNVRNVDEEKAKEWLEINCLDQTFNAEFLDSKNDTQQVIIYFAEEGEQHQSIISLNQQLQAKFPMKIDSAVLNRCVPSETTSAPRRTKMNYVRGTEVDTIPDEHEFKWMTLKQGTIEKAKCLHVDGVDALYFQLTRFKDKLEKMMCNISNEADDLKSVRFLEMGTPCIAHSHSDDLSWYRGRVVTVDTGCATVDFVDYGRRDFVIMEDIRIIKRPDMLVDPIYCIRCRLSGVDVLKENNDGVIEYLTKTLTPDEAPDVYLKIESFDATTRITDIKLIQDNQNINEFLQNNYGPCDVLRHCPLRPGDQVKVIIPQTKTLAQFFCVYHETPSEFLDMINSLSNTYDRTPNVNSLGTPSVGATCCVRSEVKDTWCRALISAVYQSSIEVVLADFGIIENIPMENLRALSPKFCELEMQSFAATLCDIRPSKNADSWSRDAINSFNNICQDDIITANIINCTDHVLSVALITSKGETMYELLTNQNFAEKDDESCNLTHGH